MAMAKKIVAIIATLVLSASILASCANNNTNESTTTTTKAADSGNTGEDTGNETPEDTTVAKIEPKLEEADYQGYQFRILTREYTDADWKDWTPRDVYAEEENADPINDATYKRNRYIEDKYKVEILQKFSNNMSSDLKKAVGAGDDSFDVLEIQSLRDVPNIAQSGNLVNLNSISQLDFTQPWWDQQAVKSLSIINKLYFTSGDIAIVNMDACPAIVFNKKLLSELNLENPYELVANNQWTIDKLYDMAKNSAKDLNGDGQMDWKNDRYGFIGQRDTQHALFNASGELIADNTGEGNIPVIKFGNERCYSAMDGVYKIMYDQTFTFNLHHLETLAPNTAIYPVSEDMFMSDRGLFMWCRIRIVQNLRSMETDFGILPMPKLDTAQDKYYSAVNSYHAAGMGVPMSASDLDRTGTILEALCAESMYTTVPAYYDTQLKTKAARDEDSSAMLDIIFSNTVWDIGEIYDWGALGHDMIYMSMKNDTNIASKFEKNLAKMERGIATAVTKYENLD